LRVEKRAFGVPKLKAKRVDTRKCRLQDNITGLVEARPRFPELHHLCHDSIVVGAVSEKGTLLRIALTGKHDALCHHVERSRQKGQESQASQCLSVFVGTECSSAQSNDGARLLLKKANGLLFKSTKPFFAVFGENFRDASARHCFNKRIEVEELPTRKGGIGPSKGRLPRCWKPREQDVAKPLGEAFAHGSIPLRHTKIPQVYRRLYRNAKGVPIPPWCVGWGRHPGSRHRMLHAPLEETTS
jgi:hypothetical protein